MADLNVFRTVTHSVQDSSSTVYTAPDGYTGIILSTQVANASDSTHWLDLTIQDSAAAPEINELLSQFDIPGRDAVSATSGKTVVTTGQVLKMRSSGQNKLKATIGILESLNG